MTRLRSARAGLQLGALAAFLLIGWGVGALCTSALAAADLDEVRDVAPDRTALGTLVAHVFSWIGSGWVVIPLAVVCCLYLYRQGRRASALAVALSTLGTQVIVDLDKLLVGRAARPSIIWTG